VIQCNQRIAERWVREGLASLVHAVLCSEERGYDDRASLPVRDAAHRILGSGNHSLTSELI